MAAVSPAVVSEVDVGHTARQGAEADRIQAERKCVSLSASGCLRDLSDPKILE